MFKTDLKFLMANFTSLLNHGMTKLNNTAFVCIHILNITVHFRHGCPYLS